MSVLGYLWEVVLTTATQLLVLFGPGLVLAFAMYWVSKFVQEQAIEVLGWGVYVYGIKILGTPVHEVGHAIFAIIFGHKIIAFQPFRPDKMTGTIGYVAHTYQERNLYQRIGNFFIGIGPVIICSLFVYLATLMLMGSAVAEPLKKWQMPADTFGSFQAFWQVISSAIQAIGQMVYVIFRAENFKDWKFYVFLYVAFSVGTSILLSPPDIKGAMGGFATLAGLLLAINMVTLWAGNFISRAAVMISQTYTIIYAIMLFTLVINLGFGLLLLLPASLKRARSG
jgi:hypothetical protein